MSSGSSNGSFHPSVSYAARYILVYVYVYYIYTKLSSIVSFCLSCGNARRDASTRREARSLAPSIDRLSEEAVVTITRSLSSLSLSPYVFLSWHARFLAGSARDNVAGIGYSPQDRFRQKQTTTVKSLFLSVSLYYPYLSISLSFSLELSCQRIAGTRA